MNAELERRVIERTSQLQESNTYLTSLIETSIALNESLDLNEVLGRILVPAQALNVMFVEGEHAWIVRRFGTKGLEKTEQNSLSFGFPLSWLTFQRMRASGQSIHILPSGGSNHTVWPGRKVPEDGCD